MRLITHMANYTYYRGVLKITSDSRITPESEIRVTEEHPDKSVTTVYRLKKRLNFSETDDKFIYWYSATPLTVTEDYSKKFEEIEDEDTSTKLAVAELSEGVDNELLATQLAVAELVEYIMGDEGNG